MKSYKTWLSKIINDSGKNLVYKTTFVKPNAEGKGSLYVINNELHVQFTDRETIKTVFVNILKNGSCNGIPQEIGGVEDRTITSIVVDSKKIKSLNDLINDATIVLSDLLLMETPIETANIAAAKNVIKVLKDFDTHWLESIKEGYEIYYFDIYDPIYCMGYWTTVFNNNQSTFLDFVNMQGFNKIENMVVAGGTVDGIGVGYIRPAPFSIGPIVFNPIGNEAIDINSEGMMVDYIGVLRSEPTHFKEFRIYATLKFTPNSPDGKFIGRSQEVYNTFVKCIEDGIAQVKTGEEISYSDHKLPLCLSSIKIEIQGDNPEKIKAIDIATIFNKMVLLSVTSDLTSVLENGDSFINPRNIESETDDKCCIKFDADNSMYLIPIFTDFSIA